MNESIHGEGTPFEAEDRVTGLIEQQAADPVPIVGPPEGRLSDLCHGGGLAAPPGFCNEIGVLWPIAPCGLTSL